MSLEQRVLSASGSWDVDGAPPVFPRDTLIYGTYKPGPTTTGYRGTLTYVGDFTTTSHDQVVENLYISGRLLIKHHGVTVRNCYISGGTASAAIENYASITAYSAQDPGTNIYDCTIRGDVATKYSAVGVQGRDMNLYRCNISGSIDGIGAQYANVGIYGCWVHDLAWYVDGWFGGTPTHNDALQVHGGDNFTVIGNLFENGYKGTSAMLITQDVAATSNVIIDSNWFRSTWVETPGNLRADATATGLNISQTGSTTAAMVNVQVTNNKFSALETWRVNHASLIDSGTYDLMVAAGKLHDNVYENTSTPAKITRNQV